MNRTDKSFLFRAGCCLLAILWLCLLGGCGNRPEPVPKLTEEEQKEADYIMERYSGKGWYDPDGKDVLLSYLAGESPKTPEKTVLKLAKYFVSQGADVNAKNPHSSFTPLYHATGRNPDFSAGKNSINVDLVKYLVSKGADVNAKDDSGETPLHNAARFCNVEVAKYLISKKADVNAKDKEGETPLHYVTKNAVPDSVKARILEEADKETRQRFTAMVNGNTAIAKALVAKGADVYAGDRWGKTPLDLAEERENQELVQYFSKQKPKNSSQTPSAEEKEIRDCFARYKAAILNQQGETAADCVDEKTIDYYRWAEFKVMMQDRKDMDKIPLLERILVLSLRHNVSYLELFKLTQQGNRIGSIGRTYFVYAVDNGLVGKESVEKVELTTVNVDSVDGKKAKTTVSSDGKKAPFGFDFVLEDGKWKMDLTSFFPIGEGALKAAIQQTGMSETQFILVMLEKSSGKKPNDSIWDPPKPTAEEEKIVSELRRQEAEEQRQQRMQSGNGNQEQVPSNRVPLPSQMGQIPIGPRGFSGRMMPFGGESNQPEEPEPQQPDNGNPNEQIATSSPPSNEQRPPAQPNPGQSRSAMPFPPNFNNSLGMSRMGTAFSEATPNGYALVGFAVTLKKWGANDCMESIQPLYRSTTGTGTKRGAVYGNTTGESKQVAAPAGYAVGAINGRAVAVVDGFELICMKIKPDGTLDPNDSKTSPWVGNNEPGARKTIDGKGKTITEIKGFTADYLSSLEIVF